MVGTSCLVFKVVCISYVSPFVIVFPRFVKFMVALFSQGEIPIEELLQMYGGDEEDSTDLPSDEDSSDESSEEGTITEIMNCSHPLNL